MRFHHYALASVLALGLAAPAAAQRGQHRGADRSDVREERRELRADRQDARELAQLRRDFWDAQRTFRRHDDRRIERRLMRWTRQQVRAAHRELRDEQRELAYARSGRRGPGDRYEIRDERGEYRNAQRDFEQWQQAQARIQQAVRTNSLDDSDFVYLQNVTRREIAEERRELQEERASRRANTRVRVRPRQVVTPPRRYERTYTWTLDI